MTPPDHGQRAEHDRRERRDIPRLAAHLGNQHSGFEYTEVVATHPAGKREREQPCLGESLPGGILVPWRGAAEDIGRRGGDHPLDLVELEVHQRASSLGSPSTRSATSESSIWLVPPAMLRHLVSRKLSTASAARPSAAAP